MSRFSVKGSRTLAPASSKRSKETNEGTRKFSRVPVTFEEGTGYAPNLLAERVAMELRALLRNPSYDAAMPAIIEEVSARAERCWLAQSRWRIHWSRVRHAAPIIIFFRHWTAAAALRCGVRLPTNVRNCFAMGRTPSQPEES